MGFLINSDIHPFILRQPELLACQVEIGEPDYKFLSHTSYINCVDLYEFDDKELLDRRSPINIITIAKIKKAVKNSATIITRYQKLILHS
jgi:hypothetical protein